MSTFYSSDGRTICINIRLTPSAHKESIGEIYVDSDGACYLKLSIRAKPEDGRANAALINSLAAHLGIAKSTITLFRGHASRTKQLQMPCTEKAEEGLMRLKLAAKQNP